MGRFTNQTNQTGDYQISNQNSGDHEVPWPESMAEYWHGWYWPMSMNPKRYTPVSHKMIGKHTPTKMMLNIVKLLSYPCGGAIIHDCRTHKCWIQHPFRIGGAISIQIPCHSNQARILIQAKASLIGGRWSDKSVTNFPPRDSLPECCDYLRCGRNGSQSHKCS